MKILSTKTLTPKQKSLFTDSGISVVEYDAVRIKFNAFTYNASRKNYIFTSQNAVLAFLWQEEGFPWGKHIFCVGKKTKKLLQKHKQKVVETAENAMELAKIITKKHKNTSFLFFCGNWRRDELPSHLSKNGVKFKEITVYRSVPNFRMFNDSFDGILFFSPSAVRTYTTANNIEDSIAYCIGKTTAKEAKNHTKKVKIAKKQEIESVIQEALSQTKKK